MLPVCIAIALAALFALVRGGSDSLPIATGPPPLDEIDEPSRQRLERVLRDAEREEPRR